MSKPAARIAVCGAGWWSQGWHLPQLANNPRAKITAIVEPVFRPNNTFEGNLLNTDQLSKHYDVPVFSSVDDLFSSNVELDGVIVCTNHDTHADIGIASLKRGLHVLMEKPMTADVRQARELQRQAKISEGQIFMVNNTANWRAGSIKARELIEAGKIGEIRHGATFFWTPLNFVFENPANVGWVKPSGTMLNNGFGWGQFSHTFSWLYMVSGLTPRNVFAFTGLSENTGADVYDAVSIECTNGATLSISGVANMPGDTKLIDHRFVGSEGMLVYAGKALDRAGAGQESEQSPGRLELTRFDGHNELFHNFQYENTQQGGLGPESLQAFVDGICGLPYFCGADADVGLKAVATIDAIYRSAQSKKAEAVYISEFNEVA